ncbi:hypothetical protein PoB_003977000 [Plakobranchus ocellatus]|uniref:Uncharacterized protein n=1 Tax=Plakobranchus ocellatus TaxID=259542 RepID=A0AAV4B111_9GAST|nr:hypothetical protein PoB_003977000 [Plakobranchus ocellatus]
MKAQTHSQNREAQCHKTETTLVKAKTYTKASVRTRSTKPHPSFRAHDQYHTLNKEEESIIVRVRTGSENTCTSSLRLERHPSASVDKGLNQLKISH